MYIIFHMKNNESFDNDPLIMKSKDGSNFRALKTLVDTENTLRMVHNRIKVLNANQNKNTQKIHLQLQTITKIQNARQRQSIHNHMVESGRKQLERYQSEVSLKNKAMKNQHTLKIDEVYRQISNQKKSQYLQIEENSQIAEKVINSNRQKQHKLKEEKRLKVSQSEEASKLNLLKYHETRQSRIKQNKNVQLETLKHKEAKKQKELRKLGSIEMELIQKQSQSQAAYLQVKNKLDSLLNNVKQQHHRSKHALKASVHIQNPRMIM